MKKSKITLEKCRKLLKKHQIYIERSIEEESRVEMKPVTGKRIGAENFMKMPSVGRHNKWTVEDDVKDAKSYLEEKVKIFDNFRRLKNMEIPTSFTGKLAIIDGHYILQVGCEIKVCSTIEDLKTVLYNLIDKNITTLQAYEVKDTEAMKARGAVKEKSVDDVVQECKHSSS